ncbi:MAG: hypothetical protein WD227_16820, partial [Vicinamibacterales bacterium]
LPYTLSRSPLRRLAPFAWLARCRSFAPSPDPIFWIAGGASGRILLFDPVIRPPIDHLHTTRWIDLQRFESCGGVIFGFLFH